MVIPTKWSDITLVQYIEIRTHLKDYKGTLDEKITLLSILTDKSEEYYSELPIKVLKEISNDLSFLQTEIDKSFSGSFKLKGVTFVVTLNIADLKASNYIDIINYLKDNGADRNIHKIMACLCKPKNKWYKKIEMSKADMEVLFLNEMPITIAYPICSFFLNFWIDLMPVMQTYLEGEVNEIVKQTEKIVQMKRDSKKSGDGL